MITNEYELDKYCYEHPHCNGCCMSCPAFVSLQRYELGIEKEEDVDEDNEEESTND